MPGGSAMPSRRAALSVAAALEIMATPVGALPAGTHMVSLCTGTGVIRLALPDDNEMPEPDDCMKACHALCAGRRGEGKRRTA